MSVKILQDRLRGREKMPWIWAHGRKTRVFKEIWYEDGDRSNSLGRTHLVIWLITNVSEYENTAFFCISRF